MIEKLKKIISGRSPDLEEAPSNHLPCLVSSVIKHQDDLAFLQRTQAVGYSYAKRKHLMTIDDSFFSLSLLKGLLYLHISKALEESKECLS